MEIIKSKSASFTGHRIVSEPYDLVSHITTETIIDLHKNGYNTFLTGMAEGFDIIAGISVIEAKINNPEIRLVAVIPFQGQTERFSEENKRLYNVILKNADHVVTLFDHYFKDIFLRRNDFLIDNASHIVCYYSGQRGGTMYTVNRAKNAGLEITNIYQI